MKTSSQYQMAKGAVLAILLIVTFGVVQPAAAQELIPQPGSFLNISIEVAHDMLNNGNSPDPIVLDVRYQCEYNSGHLFDAVLIPYDHLEENMSELDAYKDHEIIVYCKSGVRSLIACDILASHDFTRVYNMEGGILAWIDAGFPIYTTYHYATVNVVDEDIVLQIEPLLPHLPDIIPCTQNGASPSQPTDGQPTNIQSTVVEQNDSCTVVRVTYEVNDIMSEITVTNTLLWSYSELGGGSARAMRFEVMEIAGQDSFRQEYSLSYSVQQLEYNFTVRTILVPSDSGAYDSAATVISYASTETPEIVTRELVNFSSSVTLSDQYAILGKVAKKIGDLYGKSGNEDLEKLAPRYRIMSEEARYLSGLVKHQVPEYNREIQNSRATEYVDGGGGGSSGGCSPSQTPDCGWYCNACCLCTAWNFWCLLPYLAVFIGTIGSCFLCVVFLQWYECGLCLLAIIGLGIFNPQNAQACCLGTWYWDCCCPPG